MLEQLGWTVNWDKSSLTPSLCKFFIGYMIDNSKDGTLIKTPKDRIMKLRKDIKRVLSTCIASARSLARVAGQCVSMYKCVLPAKLLLRNLYRLLNNRQSWQDTLHIDTDTVKDLQWWYESLTSWNGFLVDNSEIECQIVTDASSTGWGAWIPGKNAQGFWNHRMSNKHSNFRELFVVLMGLQSFKKNLAGKTVQVLSGNVTTVAFIQQMGGSQKELDLIARDIHVLVYIKRQVRIRQDELESRSATKSQFHIRVDVTSKPISVDRTTLGTSSNRSFCINFNNSAGDVQLDVLGPVYIGSRCVRTKRLVQFKQLCERPVCITQQCLI